MPKYVYLLASVILFICIYILWQKNHNDKLIATNEQLHTDIAKYPQDCSYYLPTAFEFIIPQTAYDPNSIMEAFKRYYFSPWQDSHIDFQPDLLPDLLKEKQTENIEKYIAEPGFGINRYPIDSKDMLNIQHNMDLDNFPNFKQSAIAIRATNSRGLPTNTPSFDDWNIPGEGYPFDNLQDALIKAYEPLRILHQSRDGAWLFVITNGYFYGWVPRIDVAYVSKDFINNWTSKTQYIAPIEDNVFVKSKSPLPTARIGQVLPLNETQNENNDTYQILGVLMQENGYAKTVPATINRSQAQVMPLMPTTSNFALVANNLLGQSYGWGEIENLRDCSAMVRDLVSPFGIWIPRNSKKQVKASDFTSLANLTIEQKEKRIRQEAIPGLTLIWMPGHIMVYLGINPTDQKPYVLHNIWGLRTKQPNCQYDGRAIVGKAVITPVDFGARYDNVANSLLGKAQGLLQLNQRLLNPDADLELFKEPTSWID